MRGIKTRTPDPYREGTRGEAPSDEFALPGPGQTFGRYRIEAKLGEGSFGAVFRARDVRLQRRVALKLLFGTEDEASWGRVLREAQAASALNHPNICSTFDCGEEDGQRYIAMEYVEGQPLSALSTGDGLPAAQALKYAAQIASALAHAHSHGVVHRDLKPANVMVNNEGQAKVLDFGVARRFEPGEIEAVTQSRTSLAEAGPVAGTLTYMAPELLRGKPAGPPSDVWSLGALLHEMLTGRPPFLGSTPFELSVAIMMGDLPRLPSRVPQVARSVLRRCLDKDPARRPASADLSKEFQSALSRGRPKWRRRGWVAAAVLAGVLAALLGVHPDLLHQRTTVREAVTQGIPSVSEGQYLAVLPFRVTGDKQSAAYLAEGLRTELSARLSQLRGLHVTWAEPAERERGETSLSAAARHLGANLLVDGTVQRAGGDIDVFATLHDMNRGAVVWSRQFIRPAGKVLGLEDEIYAELVTALGAKPSTQEALVAGRHPTGDAQAYDDYLRGREALRAAQDPEAVSRAIEFFDLALEKDHRFALAYAGIADASLVTWRNKRDRFWADKALQSALQAQKLDDALPEVHRSLGSVYSATGRTAEAIAELRRALELAPSSDEGYRRLSTAYLVNGQKDEAIRASQRAVHLNPYYWANYNSLGTAYYEAGEDSRALTAWLKIRELEPDNVWGYENVGAVYLVEGQYERAIPEFQTALNLQQSADLYSDLGTALFYLKRYAEAVGTFEKAAEMSPDDETIAGNLADAYLRSGHPAKADRAYARATSLAYRGLQVNPRDSNALQHLALYCAHRGAVAEARHYVDRARAIDPHSVDGAYTEAVVETLAGRQAEALKALREALEKGYSPKRVADDPEMDPLRRSARFEALISEFSTKRGRP